MPPWVTDRTVTISTDHRWIDFQCKHTLIPPKTSRSPPPKREYPVPGKGLKDLSLPAPPPPPHHSLLELLRISSGPKIKGGPLMTAPDTERMSSWLENKHGDRGGTITCNSSLFRGAQQR
ncbi:unnamed protein product [Gadus morhua 'NCC']